MVIAWVAFCGWVLAGLSTVAGIEEPSYDVVRSAQGYEVRRYSPQLAAAVSATGPWTEAYALGASLLRTYAAGDNTTAESVAAGRPQVSAEGENIAGAVPLFSAVKGDGWTISMVVPEHWSDVTLPRPNDPRIRILRIPERTVAVLTFSGSSGRDRVVVREARLRDLLARDKAVILGPATLAQYQPAWVPPFLRRNEIIVPIRP